MMKSVLDLRISVRPSDNARDASIEAISTALRQMGFEHKPPEIESDGRIVHVGQVAVTNHSRAVIELLSVCRGVIEQCNVGNNISTSSNLYKRLSAAINKYSGSWESRIS